jgi:hypothetical protein
MSTYNWFHLDEDEDYLCTARWQLRSDAPVPVSEYSAYCIPDINPQWLYGEERYDLSVLAETKEVLAYLEHANRPEAQTVRDVLIPYLEKWQTEDNQEAAKSRLKSIQNELAALNRERDRIVDYLLKGDMSHSWHWLF